MKSHTVSALAFLLAAGLRPATALAEFSFQEIPKFVEDQTPDWIFDLLTTILLGILDVFFSGLFGISSTA